jgi:hypothetical protein
VNLYSNNLSTYGGIDSIPLYWYIEYVARRIMKKRTKLINHHSRLTKQNDDYIKRLAKENNVPQALVLRFIIEYAEKNNYDIHTK